MTAGRLRLAAARRGASGGEAETALGRLGGQPGIYFGVDGGIPGLHPRQATLVHRPALVLRLFGDGVQVQPLTAFGRALLRQPPLAAWAEGPLRGQGCSPVALVRGFMRCFEPSADVLLAGALPFAAHRLAAGAPAWTGRSGPAASLGADHADTEPLGLLFLPEAFLRRDAGGAWELVSFADEEDAPTPDAAAAQASAAERASRSEEPRDDLQPGGYAAMVERAVALLAQRPLVSLTLSQYYRRRVDMPPAQAFRRLRDANPAPATFFVNDGGGECLLGASPDLQLVVRDREIEALPVCGTVARGAGAVGEADSVRELVNEEVDAASLAVCTDALRNDLAPLCEPGSLRLLDRRRAMALSTVVHAVDRLAGRLRDGCDAWDAIVATAAPVMVTGTPRAEALAAIAELESSPRGWYGGQVVQVDSRGDALVGTILRAAAVRDGVAQVRTGGDLLAGSSPAREEQESRLKTRSLWRAFGLEAAAPPGVASAGPHALPAAVRLVAEGDAFAAALADCLAGLGLAVRDAAALTVLAGTQRIETPRQVLAIGDAAVALLEAQGYAAQAIEPQHGRLVRCTRTAAAPGGADSFIAAVSLRRQLATHEARHGWSVWARDEERRPQVLVHGERRLACFLIRPESLLSQPAAVTMLLAALALCAKD